MSEKLQRLKERVRLKKGDLLTVAVYRVKFVWQCPGCESINSYTHDLTTVVVCPDCDSAFRTQVIDN